MSLAAAIIFSNGLRSPLRKPLNPFNEVLAA
jgi:hypothetical protein